MFSTKVGVFLSISSTPVAVNLYGNNQAGSQSDLYTVPLSSIDLRATDDMDEKRALPPGYEANSQMLSSDPTPPQVIESSPPQAMAPVPDNPPQPIIVQVQQRKSNKIPKYNRKLSKIAAIVQVVAGGLAILLNSLGYIHNFWAIGTYYTPDVVEMYGYYYGYHLDPTWAYFSSTGIWCPLLFFSLSGTFGLCASCKKTKCLIITNMVLSIVSSFFAVIMLGFAIWAFAADLERLNNGFEYTLYNPDTEEYDNLLSDTGAQAARWIMALSTFWLLTSLVEITACIWSAILCCQVMCCGANRQNDAVPSVQYTSNPDTTGSQLLVLDSQGRPIQGAQVVQIPGTSQAQAPLMNPGSYPQNQMASGGQPVEDSKASLLPPPYQE